MPMPIPSYGAAPLSMTFLGVRVLQVICMITVVGMTANFVSEIVTHGIEAQKELVGTLSVTCIATLYCIVSIAFFWSQAELGLFVMGGVDGLLLIAFIVVSVSLGRPISFLNCAVIDNVSAAADAAAAYAFTTSLAENMKVTASKLPLVSWVGTTRTNCYEAKAIWGLSIALCILFTTSCALLPTLWYKNKKVVAPPKVEV